MENRMYLIDGETGYKVVSTLTNHGLSIEEMFKLSGYRLPAYETDDDQLIDDATGKYVNAWHSQLVIVDSDVYDHIEAAREIIERGCYDAAVELMDDDIREDLATEIAPCPKLQFLAEYMAMHKAFFNEEFKVD